MQSKEIVVVQRVTYLSIAIVGLLYGRQHNVNIT
jgi:hypothetical protein